MITYYKRKIEHHQIRETAYRELGNDDEANRERRIIEDYQELLKPHKNNLK